MRYKLYRLLCLVGITCSFTVNAQLPRTLVMDPARLAEVKQKYMHNDPVAVQLVDKVKNDAEKLLAMKPVSVMDKTITPVSGSKHDYMSQAPYFWYDSSKPNGLPYMRKDGVRNPEINKITDHNNLGDLGEAAKKLSLAWYFTGSEKYAQKAATLLEHWFLNDATRMNPNLDYGQGIPGVNTGRGIGLIETRSLMGIADAAGLLQGAAAWTTADANGLQQWYKQFLNWMLTSKNGNDEHAAKNNHGSWYYAQVVDYALFTGDIDKARGLAEESKKRIDGQIDAEGKQPLELERTNALGYSTFNLAAQFELAALAEKTGVDLWHYKNPLGVGLRDALNWLQPYALGEKPFAYQQISGYNKNEIYVVLLKAAKKYNDPKYLAAAVATKENGKNIMAELLYGK
jgi:hypothetical protein